MAGGIFTGNTTIKVNAAVSATASSTNTSLYTAPSAGYAIVNLFFSYTSGAGPTITLDGKSFAVFGAANVTIYSLYIGPSQVLSYIHGGGAVSSLTVTGVSFLNTP